MNARSLVSGLQIPAYPMTLPSSLEVATGILGDSAVKGEGGSTMTNATFPFVDDAIHASRQLSVSEMERWGGYLLSGTDMFTPQFDTLTPFTKSDSPFYPGRPACSRSSAPDE